MAALVYVPQKVLTTFHTRGDKLDVPLYDDLHGEEPLFPPLSNAYPHMSLPTQDYHPQQYIQPMAYRMQVYDTHQSGHYEPM